MREKPRGRAKKDRRAHRRRDDEIVAVPTFQPEPQADNALAGPQDDLSAEAVRRMVEAAYT